MTSDNTQRLTCTGPLWKKSLWNPFHLPVFQLLQPLTLASEQASNPTNRNHTNRLSSTGLVDCMVFVFFFPQFMKTLCDWVTDSSHPFCATVPGQHLVEWGRQLFYYRSWIFCSGPRQKEDSHRGHVYTPSSESKITAKASKPNPNLTLLRSPQDEPK